MKILITGSDGQVGKALQRVFAEHQLLLADLPAFDITKMETVQQFVDEKPDLIIHPAALTNVDACAKNPNLAYFVNAFGTQNMALVARRTHAPMVYISTNEVFDGTASVPYHEFSPTNPINPYAASKLSGEQIAARLVQQLYIVRIAWAFDKGSNMFPAKIIRAADKNGEVKVVTDEISSPTYVPDLVIAIKQLVATQHFGTYHLTNEGVCSRYDFAKEILRLSGRGDVPLYPITSDAFERASTPPPYAPLANNLAAALGITMRPWQEALVDYFAD